MAGRKPDAATLPPLSLWDGDCTVAGYRPGATSTVRVCYEKMDLPKFKLTAAQSLAELLHSKLAGNGASAARLAGLEQELESALDRSPGSQRLHSGTFAAASSTHAVATLLQVLHPRRTRSRKVRAQPLLNSLMATMVTLPSMARCKT
jgi:hypothetical protein